MEKNVYSIFKTFFKVGTLLLGGGYVILPLLTSELVDKKHWISSEELCEYYALGASLPGIIAANVAIFTGKKLLGLKGAIAATVGMILPAFLAIVLLASILSELVTKPSIQNIFWGVGIGVITLLFMAVKEMLISYEKLVINDSNNGIFMFYYYLTTIKAIHTVDYVEYFDDLINFCCKNLKDNTLLQKAIYSYNLESWYLHYKLGEKEIDRIFLLNL